MKSSDKLIKRLVVEGFIEDDLLVFERLYPTYEERSDGAWSWEITSDGITAIGSKFAVYEILKASKLVLAGGVWPEVRPSNP